MTHESHLHCFHNTRDAFCNNSQQAIFFYDEERPSPDQHPRWGIVSCRLSVHTRGYQPYTRTLSPQPSQWNGRESKQAPPLIQVYSDPAVRIRSVWQRSENKHYIHAVSDTRGNGWDFIPWLPPQYNSGVLCFCFIPVIQYFLHQYFMKAIKTQCKEEAITEWLLINFSD